MEDAEAAERKARGKIIRGSPSAALPPEVAKPQKSVSTIPAKFETVLFKGPREKKGFGSEGKRFGNNETEVPGPGAHDVTIRNLDYHTESIGKKGFGAMASKSKSGRGGRFAYTGPGPGQYKPLKAADIEKYFNKSSTTAVFADKAKSVKPLPPKLEGSGPGPGAYTPAETRSGQKLDWRPPQSHHSAFKATPHKLTLCGNLEAPPPSKYSLPDPWESKSLGKGGTSSFAGGASLSSLAGMQQQQGLIFMDDAKSGKPDTGPGPGTYELQYFSSIRNELEKGAGKASANFQPREFTDRFGRSLAAPRGGSAGPGPGSQGGGVPALTAEASYAAGAGATGGFKGRRPGAQSAGPSRPQRINGPMKGVSAPFVSQSPGHADFDLKSVGRAPGPAYYSPEKPDRRSYHLNARKRQVP